MRVGFDFAFFRVFRGPYFCLHSHFDLLRSEFTEGFECFGFGHP